MPARTVIDFAPALVELKLTRDDDHAIEAMFKFDLTGYQNWAAQLRPATGSTTHVDFDVDDSDQISGNIVFTLLRTQVDMIDTGWIWDMEVDDPDGKHVTFMYGKVTVVKANR